MALKSPSSLKSYSYYESLLSNPQVQAVLNTIAKAEGTFANSGIDPYATRVGYVEFDNTGWHPQTVVPGTNSTASGKYQAMGFVFPEVAQAIGIPNIGPVNQDVFAIARMDQRGVLDAALAGNIDAVIDGLGQEFASFPNNNYGQGQKTKEQLKDWYTGYLATATNTPANLGGVRMNSVPYTEKEDPTTAAQKGLAGMGYVPADDITGAYGRQNSRGRFQYDLSMVEGVKAFQEAYGLPATGELDDGTLSAIATQATAQDARDARLGALPSALSGINAVRPEAAIDFVSRIAGRPETVGALPMQATRVATPPDRPVGSLPAAPPSYQTDNRATQAMYDALPQDTYFQDKLEKAAKAENDKIGLSSRFPGMGDIAERTAPSYPPSTGISAAIGGAGRPSAPSVGSMPGATPAGLGGLNYSVAPASRPSAPPMSAGSARTPAQLGGLNYSVPPATQPSLADQYASYGAGKATTNRAPNDTRASAYRSMPPAPVMAAAIDRIDIPGSAKPAAPAISPSTLAAQYASYGAGKIAPTQTAASATQSAPKPSQAIAQKAAPPAMSAAPRTVAPRQVTPYAPPAAPAMTPERAKALGMVETVPGMYMPNVAANPAQVMRDQAGLIAANPIASIGKMLAGTMLGGVFHAGGGLRNAAQNVAQAVGGNRQQSERDRLANALASVAMGGVGGSYNGPGGIGGYSGGGFQASPSGFGNYGSDGSFNGGMQSSSGFQYDR